MNQLEEIARVRAHALDALQRPKEEVRALAALFALLPAGVHWVVTDRLLPAYGVLALVVVLLVRVGRLRRRSPLPVLPRLGPGPHRWGPLLALPLGFAIALSAWSPWVALAATALCPAAVLLLVPWHDEARRRALLDRISGADPLAGPTAAPADFEAPGAATLSAFLQLTTTVPSVARLAPALGADPDELVAAARALDAVGAVRAGRLKLPGRAPSPHLFAQMTPAGLQAWQQHVATLESAARA